MTSTKRLRPAKTDALIIHPNVEIKSHVTGPFRFMDLPAELRLVVYFIYFMARDCVVDTILRARIAALALVEPGTKVDFPTMVNHAPSLLFVCKQIYHEANPFHNLARRYLTMNHGLLDFQLGQLISRDTFRNLRSLIITHDGHNIMDPHFPRSFVGHQQLAMAAANWLRAPGHHLEELELHFSSPQLERHMKTCYHIQNSCDIRCWVFSIFSAWKQVHGLRKVTITGWLPEEMKVELVRTMQAPYHPLSLLPDHIFQQIAAPCLDLSSISRAINAVNDPFDRTVLPVALSTPGLLGVTHHLNSRAASVLSQTPLMLDLIHPPFFASDLTSFITRKLLRRLTRIVIRIRHRAWLRPLLQQTLPHVFAEAFHSLTSLVIIFEDDELPVDRFGRLEQYPDADLAEALVSLSLIRGEGLKFSFGGDLARPEVLKWAGLM